MAAAESSATQGITRRALIGGAVAALPLVGCRRARSAVRGTTDVCVIGSGFAGTYLAQRLADAGLSVQVLEAGGTLGPTAHADGARRLFPVVDRGPVSYPVVASRSIAVGGTSRKWGGTLLRLSPEDLSTRTLFGYGEDWPLRYGEIAAHYCEAERLLHAVGAPFRRDAEPARDCAYPTQSLVEPPLRDVELANGEVLRFFRYAGSRRPESGTVPRLADVEVPALAAHPRVDFRESSPVTRLLVGDGRTVDEVEVQHPLAGLQRLRARIVVVAAGTFESARLLLASSSPAHPAGLGNAGGRLGRHFFAHPVARFRHVPNEPSPIPAGFFRSISASSWLRRQGWMGCGHKVLVFADHVSVRVQPEGDALEENSVSLTGEGTDPFGRRAMVLSYRFSDHERGTLASAEQIAGELAGRLDLGQPIGEPERTERMHPSGLCRMAADSSRGVVDPDLKVFGLENLYVVGGAVFPTNGVANPTLTIVALALRLADHLLARHFADRL